VPESPHLSSIDVTEMLSSRRITADYIADSLRDAINAGELEDGAGLNQVEIAAHFGVSRVPVREALRQLQAQGLVESRAHRISVVRGIDRQRLSDVFTLRAMIEGWLTQRATPYVDPATLGRAREINASLLAEEDHPSWLDLNREFHRLLFGCASSEQGLEILEPLRQRSERYTRLWSRGDGLHRPRQSCQEHTAILDAIECGDAESARALAEEHVLHTRDDVLAFGDQMRTTTP